MFNSKNISLRTLAFFVSFVLATFVAFMLIYFERSRIEILSAFVSTGLICYFLVYYTIDRFVYRKIKLIYKFISQTKATKREEFYNKEILPRKTIEDVNNDVAKWAAERKGEIEQLQNNEQFRKEFLMNLAHELKTPIFSAQGFIDTLLAGAMHDEKVRSEFLQKAGKSIDRLSDLVNDLDEISKMESNRLPIHKATFIIQDVIRDVFEESGQKANIKGIKLLIKKGCEQDIAVMADRSKIKQVLVNLIQNSINYGKENGETNAGIYVIDGREVFIEITDDGIGISEDQIPRVFERFYRTDTARSRNEGGTGLGLAIVKHIVEAHGHTVSCRSKVDVGTSFGFTLDKGA